jgi:nicotinamidase-related amidase
MVRTLMIIDIQNDYFDGGGCPLVGSASAVGRARQVLEHFRSSGDPVVHVQHVWDEPEATFMRPGTPGVEIHASLAPRPDEPVVTKSTPNALLVPELVELLDAQPSRDLVVMGMMSSTCVDSTVRAAADAGFSVELVHDACAAPDLEFAGAVVPGEVVHAAFMSALGEDFATLRSADELTRG